MTPSAAVVVGRLLGAELAEQGQDLVLALERELHVLAVLAVVDLDDLVRADAAVAWPARTI